MAVNRLTAEPTFTELISDVAADVNELAAAHLQQLRDEIAEQTARARAAGVAATTGGVIALVGVTFVLVAVVHALIDYAGWSPTLAWAVVGGVMIAIAGILLAMAYQQWKSFHAVPQQTLESVKESLSCVSHP